jgi:hypothetical protein
MKSGRCFMLALCCLALLSGCGKSSNSTTPASASTAQQKVTQANAALENILYTLAHSTTSPTRPSDLDFRTPEGLYREALALEPGNLDANFGVSVLGLMVLTSDTEVNAAFDEWSQYLQGKVPFQAKASPMRPFGIPLAPLGDPSSLRLPFRSIPLALVGETRLATLTVDPQLSRAQAILHDRVLPRLNEAIARLAVVGASPGYQFIVTPRMQGDPGAAPAEIDRTDILAMRAAVSLLAAICHVAVSYNLSFQSYDQVGLVQALTPGSGWLALASDGSTQMSSAYSATLDAIDGVSAATTSLLAETDDQSDDVIKMTRVQAESVLAEIPNVRAGFTGGWYVTADWDANTSTPDVTLLVRPATLLNAPVPDWKDLLPPYTPSAVQRPYTVNYWFEYSPDTAIVEIPSTGYYSGGYSLSRFADGTTYEYSYGSPELTAAMQRVVGRQHARISVVPGWTGTFSCSAYFNGTLTAGLQSIPVEGNDSYETAAVSVWVPVITWQAPSYSEWVAGWPDPTLHGLLPEMTTPDQLMTTFGMSAARWKQELVLDWTRSAGAGVHYITEPRHATRPAAARVRVAGVVR